MAQPPYILAIDLGTSGPKVALVARDGVVAASAFEPVALHLFPGGGAEQDPTEWWAAIGAATRHLLGSGLVPLDQIAGISVTSQWSGTVAMGSDGAAIGNAIIWMDSRGARYVEELIGGPVRFQGYDPRKLRKWLSLTGGAPAGSGKDSIAHILYLRNDVAAVYDAATMFLEPKDYLNYRLTGTMAASFDSIALHWVTDNRDPASIDYDEDLLGYAGIERSRLPDLFPATSVIGGLTAEAAAHLDLAADIPVIAGTPDVHSAAIGAGTRWAAAWR